MSSVDEHEAETSSINIQDEEENDYLDQDYGLFDWLSKIDVFAPKIQMQFKGETQYRSATGGLISIGTFMVFVLLMYFKIINHFGGDITPHRRNLQNIVNKDEKLDAFGWNFFSKDNFKFYSYTNGDLNQTLWNSPLNVK